VLSRAVSRVAWNSLTTVVESSDFHPCSLGAITHTEFDLTPCAYLIDVSWTVKASSRLPPRLAVIPCLSADFGRGQSCANEVLFLESTRSSLSLPHTSTSSLAVRPRNAHVLRRQLPSSIDACGGIATPLRCCRQSQAYLRQVTHQGHAYAP
jgi:hypothetical protein